MRAQNLHVNERKIRRVQIDSASRKAPVTPWKEIVDDLYFPFSQEVISCSTKPSMSYGLLPMRDFSICRIEMSGDVTITGWRNWKMIREHNRRAFLIWLTVDGRYECQQAGKTFVSDNQNICLTRSDQPFRITAFPDKNGNNLAYQIMISSALMERYFGSPSNYPSDKYNINKTSVRFYHKIISDIYEWSPDNLDETLDPIARSLLESIAISFRQAVFGDDVMEERPTESPAAHVVRCTQDHLTDPDIGPARVAQKCGISTRHVHRIFQGMGTSFSRYVHDLRLDRAHRMLANPCFADMTIGEIAFDTGFNAQSHFNKLFLARYGRTPGSVRSFPDAIPVALAEYYDSPQLGSGSAVESRQQHARSSHGARAR